MDFEQARFNMIEQQIRPWEVLDQRVLSLLGEVPREDFVPEEYRQLAFSDIEIPLPHGQIMMAPKIEARLIQALDIQPDQKILEIGTGSGYVTALLARSGAHVTSIELYGDMTKAAAEKLESQKIQNVRLLTQDAMKELPQGEEYDIILVTASLPVLDERLKELLARNGRMAIVLGQSPAMQATLVTRVSAPQWEEESLFETDLPALIGARQPDRFVF